ncbi:MAG: protein translocase subunit SecF [Prochlorococcus marinus CUG1439]|uniref:protein translocase subunit SecF n=1 Tax=Prochlorococcus sp. MIT 1314 TaxID=3096220 RepID=UPI001B0E89E8|nr:protein translocase subunit SecF [Prochlorococcus sp. MIT 1314]MCR8540193.1 protein translocase subunit SecF [Prochlorococcus marinus CUG1439]
MKLFNLDLIKNKRKIIFFSTFLLLLSLLGILYSTFNTSYKKPINLGMDFIGGNELRIERVCPNECSYISPDLVLENLRESSKNKNLFNTVNLQFQNNNKLVSIRTPYLNIEESNNLINNLENIIGPLNYESKNSRLIGPKLGKRLLTNCATSLVVSLFAISLYITIRFDRKYALFALLALFHDLLIVFGIFSWLGIILSVEVNSLFAVSLLTIAGYSVNDTVVIFDRIRENLRSTSKGHNEIIQLSVNESFRRTTFTSITTLIPLITLILFGSYSLFWFSISLSLGIIIGSYSSILLAPSFLLKD